MLSKSLVAILAISFSFHVRAEEKMSNLELIRKEFRNETPKIEQWANFGAVYLLQWGFYYSEQEETIRKYGSFKNWIKNPTKPHFDKDSFDYNLTKHMIVGNYYFLFYRSREYPLKSAFLWTFASSLAFEFTIETLTERPSFQDIYQTPIYGTILGIGVERSSAWLHQSGTWYGKTLGYILNPFTLIPSTNHFVATPMLFNKGGGYMVTWRF